MARRRRWTYRELVADVDRLARGLLADGVEPGDRVGIWAPNRAEWVLVQYATAKIGAILVNVNPAYRTHEVAYVIQQAGISTMVVAESFKTSDYPAMLDEVRDRCETLRRTVVLGSRDWDDLLVGRRRVPAEELARVQGSLSPGDPINIQYTSGTTGFPKGATLSHRNILNNGYFVGEGCRYTDADRICIPVPFYHCFGMVMGNLAATSHGACMVIPAPGFDPAATLRAVDAGAVHLAVRRADDVHRHVGAARLRRLRHLLAAHRHHGRLAVSGRDDAARSSTLGIADMTICYGMTETSPVSTQTAPTTRSRRRSAPSAGSVRTWRSGRRPGDRRPLPRGEAGELCTKGYSVMVGYWDRSREDR